MAFDFMESLRMFILVTGIFIALTSGAFACECWDGSHGAVGCWEMDDASGDINDACTLNLDGVASGTATYQQAGVFDYSIALSSDYFTVPNSDYLDQSGDFAMALWMYPTSTSDSIVFIRRAASGDYRGSIILDSGGLLREE